MQFLTDVLWQEKLAGDLTEFGLPCLTKRHEIGLLRLRVWAEDTVVEKEWQAELLPWQYPALFFEVRFVYSSQSLCNK